MSFNKTLVLCGMQRDLDDRIIEEKGIDISPAQRFDNTMVALLVELAEFANEGRWFKIWSNNQEPNKKIKTVAVGKNLVPNLVYKNPLLEEYVDGLHFFLSLANQADWHSELEFDESFVSGAMRFKEFDSFNRLFLDLNLQLALTASGRSAESFRRAWRSFLIIGISGFGFTFDEIVEAYKAKNATNHTRQDTGY